MRRLNSRAVRRTAASSRGSPSIIKPVPAGLLRGGLGDAGVSENYANNKNASRALTP